MKPLIVAALQSEIGENIAFADVLITGVGKINAAYHLTKAIAKQNFDIVINLGTAGSRSHKRGSVVLCTEFYQRDMDVSALGFEIGVTPFSQSPAVFKARHVEGYQGSRCSSGDSFASDVAHHDQSDVFDMESYALAAVCAYENIPFVCLKYITDGASETAASEWDENYADGASLLINQARKIIEDYPAVIPGL